VSSSVQPRTVAAPGAGGRHAPAGVRRPVPPLRTRLSDGREILYFDDAPGADRSARDERGLQPVTTSSELRHDPFTDEWVVIADHRQTRTFLPSASQCPLCPTRDGLRSEVPASSYDVVVFENRFPSLAGTAPAPLPASDAGALVSAAGTGRCEVVVFTDDHDAVLARLPPQRVRTLVDAWAHRSTELARQPGVEQVFVFENRGADIGVTLQHPHGQVYAYPFVPPRARQLANAARAHRARTGGCLVCDRLALELAADERVVLRGRAWSAVVPFAARWPFEVHVVPHRHVRSLPDLDDAERDELAVLWTDVLRRLDGVFDIEMPYIASWQQAPVREADGHLFGQVLSLRRAPDKLKHLAGSESAAGAWVGDVRPETAARALRAAG
jgi:UDPglucose--hexose-1-phosphate uridylyltransferase